MYHNRCSYLRKAKEDVRHRDRQRRCEDGAETRVIQAQVKDLQFTETNKHSPLYPAKGACSIQSLFRFPASTPMRMQRERQSLSHVQFFATPWNIQLMEFSRPEYWSGSPALQGLPLHYQLSHREAQEYWSGQPIPSPGDLPDLGIKPGYPDLQVDSLPTELFNFLPNITIKNSKGGHEIIIR